MKFFYGVSWGIISLTFLFAITLMLLPLPLWAEPFRPAWVLLVVLYWALIFPHRVSIGWAWLLGLLLDILQGILLGENALTFALLTYITIKAHHRIRMFSLFGQALMVFLLIFLNQWLLFWIENLQNHSIDIKWCWASPLTSAILWPWLFKVLNNCVTRYRLS